MEVYLIAPFRKASISLVGPTEMASTVGLVDKSFKEWKESVEEEKKLMTIVSDQLWPWHPVPVGWLVCQGEPAKINK